MKTVCSNEKCEKEIVFDTEKNNQWYPINAAVVLAFRTIGKGRLAPEMFYSIMNLVSPISASIWKSHTQALLEKAKTVAERNMEQAGKDVRQVEESNTLKDSPKTIDFWLQF